MSLILLIIVGGAWLITLRFYSPFSFTFAGIVGLSIYTLPAILDSTLLFFYDESEVRYAGETSIESDLVMALVWTLTIAVIALVAVQKTPSKPLPNTNKYNNLKDFTLATLLLGLFGCFYLIIEGGATFFLAPRDEQAVGILPLLWKWTILLGLTATTLTRESGKKMFFWALLLIVFLRGDRTMIAICGVAVLVTSLYGQPLRSAARPKFIALGFVLVLLIIVGKPIYIAVKSGAVEQLRELVSLGAIQSALLNSEPFLTFQHLEFVITDGITVSTENFLISVFGNLLIMPSLFGVDVNHFNNIVTQSLPVILTYGIAGNFWAHAWSVGGVLGILFFVILYVYSLALSDRIFVRSAGVTKVAFAAFGSLVAVYTYRNGLDNMLAFVRQLVLVIAASFLLSLFLKELREKVKRRPYRPAPFSRGNRNR